LQYCGWAACSSDLWSSSVTVTGMQQLIEPAIQGCGSHHLSCLLGTIIVSDALRSQSSIGLIIHFNIHSSFVSHCSTISPSKSPRNWHWFSGSLKWVNANCRDAETLEGSLKLCASSNRRRSSKNLDILWNSKILRAKRVVWGPLGSDDVEGTGTL